MTHVISARWLANPNHACNHLWQYLWSSYLLWNQKHLSSQSSYMGSPYAWWLLSLEWSSFFSMYLKLYWTYCYLVSILKLTTNHIKLQHRSPCCCCVVIKYVYPTTYYVIEVSLAICRPMQFTSICNYVNLQPIYYTRITNFSIKGALNTMGTNGTK